MTNGKNFWYSHTGFLHIVGLTRLLCDPVTEDPSYQPAPEDRPGGFQWGQVVSTFLPFFAMLLYLFVSMFSDVSPLLFL